MQLVVLPETNQLLQEEINEMTDELGGEQFREMGDAASKYCCISFGCKDIRQHPSDIALVDRP